jgi:hypothetical protein
MRQLYQLSQHRSRMRSILRFGPKLADRPVPPRSRPIGSLDFGEQSVLAIYFRHYGANIVMPATTALTITTMAGEDDDLTNEAFRFQHDAIIHQNFTLWCRSIVTNLNL